MRKIKLSQDISAFVDDEDYERISKHRWHAHKGGNNFYAIRHLKSVKGKSHKISMHREIMGLTEGDGMVCDHINRDTCDNRKQNLRIASRLLNTLNANNRKDNASGYRGVGWHKASKKWMAHITVEGKMVHLGVFESVISAALAYDKAAIKYHGDIATVNFPDIAKIIKRNEELEGALEQLADDKGSAYWTSEEVRKIAKAALKE